MKVLQLVKYYSPSKGGMQSVVKSIIDGLLIKNDDIVFTTYSINFNKSFNRNIKYFKRLTVIKEPSFFFIKEQSINFFFPLLSKLIDKNDIIHHHAPFPNMEIALLLNLKKIKRKKLIITWHADITNTRWKPLAFIYTPVIKILLDNADKIIVSSPNNFKYSKVLQQYKNKVSIVNLCYNPKFNLNKYKTYPGKDNFKLLFVGALRKYKGINYLIDAIKFLPVELLIVGLGEEKKSLKKQVDNLGLSKKVNFKTDKTFEELISFYHNSDLFILPSINNSETFGIVQLEAMASNLPVINTNLKSGAPEVSINLLTGITVEPKNSKDLRLAIEKIINNKELYENYSKESAKRVIKFSRKKMVNSYLKLYSKC